MDFNCDFDINECTGKTHDCHVDARCVNVPGDWFCRCLSGWEGDGLTCTDLDDCDPDPCDPIHGTCEDRGPNLYECVCMPGWMGIECGDDMDECTYEDGAYSGCDPYALCANSIGSHSCTCNEGYYGDGVTCTPCTVCDPGWEPFGPCVETDWTCINIDECERDLDNCQEHATCTDNEGSFKCECDQNGPGDEWWGLGIDTEDGCLACTVCYEATTRCSRASRRPTARATSTSPPACTSWRRRPTTTASAAPWATPTTRRRRTCSARARPSSASRTLATRTT